jgi:hypothetical protein
MNIDKVEELAKKIYGVKITKNPLGNPMYEFTGTELALFAELIVRECAVPMITQARAMDAHGGYKNNPVEVTAMNLHQGLLKHFGVEE